MSVNWKTMPRLILMKTFGVILAVVFFFLALLFLAYPLISLATNHGGEEGGYET